MRNRWASTVVAVAVTACVVGLIPAHAATVYNCTLSGKTTSLTPIPAPPKTGGTGTFAFSGTAGCIVGAKVFHYGVTSSGSYVNTICGTGSAVGSATFTGGPAPINFKIGFIAGAGELTITGGGKGNGVVDITPTNSTGCISKPVTGFSILAQAVVTQ